MPYPVTLPTSREVPFEETRNLPGRGYQGGVAPPPPQYQYPQMRTPAQPAPSGGGGGLEWGAPRAVPHSTPHAQQHHTHPAQPGGVGSPHRHHDSYTGPRKQMNDRYGSPLALDERPHPTMQDTTVDNSHLRIKALVDELEHEKSKNGNHVGVLQDTLNSLSTMLDEEKIRVREGERRIKQLHSDNNKLKDELRAAEKDFLERFELYKEDSHGRIVQYMAAQKQEFLEEKERLNEHYRNIEAEMERREAALRAELAAKDQKITELETILNAGKEEVASFSEGTSELKSELQEAQKMLKDLEEDKRAAVTSLQQDRDRLEQTIELLAAELQSSNDARLAAEKASSEKDVLVASFKTSNQTLETQYTEATALSNKLSMENGLLSADLQLLNGMANSLKHVAERYAAMKQDLELGRCRVLDEYNGYVEEEEEHSGSDSEEKAAPPPPDTQPDTTITAPSGLTSQVLLNVTHDVLVDVHDALKKEVAKLHRGEFGVVGGGGGAVVPAGDRRKLTKDQVDHLGSAVLKTYPAQRTARNIFLEPFLPANNGSLGFMPVRSVASKVTDESELQNQNAFFKVLSEEWEAKPGDVLDEVLAFISTPEYAGAEEGKDFNALRRVEILAEIANFTKSYSRTNQQKGETFGNNTPGQNRPAAVAPYPGLNLVDCLLLKLFTLDAPDLDNLFFFNDVPSFLNARAYASYNAVNKSLASGLAEALSAINTVCDSGRASVDEKALSAIRPLIKTVCLLLSLASAQHCSDLSMQGGNTLCTPMTKENYDTLMAATVANDGHRKKRKKYLLCSQLVTSTEEFRAQPSEGEENDVFMLYLTGVKHGRYLQNFSMFPEERLCLIPPGLFFEMSEGSNPFSIVLRAVERIDSPYLDSLVLKAKADSAHASARLETIVAERDASAALEAMQERISEVTALHHLERTQAQRDSEKLKEEVDSMSSMVTKYVHFFFK